MKHLLDTHLLLWAGHDPDQLPPAVAELLDDPSARVCYSAASVWEVAIKHHRGKLDTDPILFEHGLRLAGFGHLSISATHAMGTAYLPDHHRDPFDRILVSQTICESPMTLYTCDQRLSDYTGAVQAFPTPVQRTGSQIKVLDRR